MKDHSIAARESYENYNLIGKKLDISIVVLHLHVFSNKSNTDQLGIGYRTTRNKLCKILSVN